VDQELLDRRLADAAAYAAAGGCLGRHLETMNHIRSLTLSIDAYQLVDQSC